jgi:hypothetical protein
MNNSLTINLSLSFENNRLNVYAKGTCFRLPFHGEAPSAQDAQFKVFRHYPLSELEARSLHFKGSNPIHWIEEHMRDLVLLEGFQQGYDLRGVDVALRYQLSFAQDEEGKSADGGVIPRETHLYQWWHNRTEDVLYMSDNGIEIGRFPVRGPQNYLQLAEFEADVKSRRASAVESEGTI